MPSGIQLSRADLTEAYRRMRTIRAFEEKIKQEYGTGIIPGFVHLYSGEEACAVGVTMHLTDNDMISSTHRGHGHCIAKGCDVEGMMKEIFGKEGGLCGGKGGSMHIADFSKGMMGANGIVGGGPPLVCGAALAAKLRKKGEVAVAFLGDGASNQGTTLESYNLAKVWNLPAIFVVEDNGYGEATPSSWAVGGDKLDRAKGFGLTGARADGHDFFAVYEIAGQAIERARSGGGPSLLHLITGRHHGHFEGDAAGYRGPGELDQMRNDLDCLKQFRARVTETSLLPADQFDAIDAEIGAAVDAAAKSAKSAAMPKGAALMTDVYVSY